MTPSYQVKLVPESDILIVSFSGLSGSMVSTSTDRPFDFFMTTKLLEYNRIVIRDPYDLFYLHGVDENGFDYLVERLRLEIARIQPRKVIFIGASAGGYGALLFGHLLGADYIHAFGTRGHIRLGKILQQRDFKSLLNRLPTIFRLLLSLDPAHRRYLDLKPVLRDAINPNPNTKIHLHACAYCVDAARAQYLSESANTQVFLYPCDQHNVAAVLLKSHCLTAMLQRNNLDRAEEVYENFYPDFDPAEPRSRMQRSKPGQALLLLGSESPDGRFEVYAVESGTENPARLELRDKSTGTAVFDLGSSRWMDAPSGHTLPSNTEISWSPDSCFMAVKMRDSKNSSSVSFYKLADGTVTKVPPPQFLDAIREELNFEFSGRFYFETPVKWESPEQVLMNVKGNTVNSLDLNGEYDFEYNVRAVVGSGEILQVQELKRPLPPPVSDVRSPAAH